MILEDIVIQTTDFRIISIVYKNLESAKNTQITQFKRDWLHENAILKRINTNTNEYMKKHSYCRKLEKIVNV